MNRALVVVFFNTGLLGDGRKLATGSPPYLYTSRPSSRAYGADIASERKEKKGLELGMKYSS